MAPGFSMDAGARYTTQRDVTSAREAGLDCEWGLGREWWRRCRRGDTSGADLGDPTRIEDLGEPQVGVRARRDPDRSAVGGQAGRELVDRARRSDPSDPPRVGALGEPQVAVAAGHDPERSAVG